MKMRGALLGYRLSNAARAADATKRLLDQASASVN